MSFAPVLDVVANDPSAEPRRKAARAAGFALRRLATNDRDLLDALRLVNGSERATNDALSERLATIDPRLLDDVANATGVSLDAVKAALLGQLRQVVDFASLDGGTLESSVGVVGELIRSGRVELFAG